MFRAWVLRASRVPARYSTTSTTTSTGELTLSEAQRTTIYALSTPPGRGALAVIRVSGPGVLDVWRALVRRQTPKPWRMERCRLVHPKTGSTLDDALAVFFKAPRSFTTQDVLELHIHGGRAVTNALLAALSALPHTRPALPGEFTRQAVLGGRLDLTQAEGVRDLVDAQTEAQRRVAVGVAGGATRRRLERLREDIVGCLALVEAVIDFGEGEDIEEGVYDLARERAERLRDTIRVHLDDKRRGEILREGVRLAIFGPPNAGKSSLLNFFAQRDAAIVTPFPGTTRDVLELALDIGGMPVRVADTAGVRRAEDPVEAIGVGRARDVVHTSDLTLCVLPLPTALVRTPHGPRIAIPPDLRGMVHGGTCFLLNKVDLVGEDVREALAALRAGDVRGVELDANIGAWAASLSTGAGTDAFLEGLAGVLRARFDPGTDSSGVPLITHARHRAHLESALAFVEAFLATPPEDIVLGAEELRYAAQAVGRVTGEISVEDVLDAVFRDFCIGK